ncbi:DUF4124 domain-containing protein [Pseudomonas oligotrophica]|uniref:DUF4124 domain-containing protein n=1 Tax=Pseudomonas oligotrophica TaxID=2912055 RepID=UPI001F3B35F3|nr:DUF4124 domain-containing protein [Pseudomonas oligotrophica]MCF7202187.1 DUF4124 domain-containing protein [Pseudomonas oligotrophica]
MLKLTTSICCLLLCSSHAAAATVYRCVDEAGRISFRQQGCPEKDNGSVQEIDSAGPSSGKVRPMATPHKHKSRADAELVVVGVQDNPCGATLTGQQRRRAIIEKHIQPGMTRADVESALGKPDDVTTSNGKARLRYRNSQGRTQVVNLDPQGCVVGNR